jgi:hypothetical protein
MVVGAQDSPEDQIEGGRNQNVDGDISRGIAAEWVVTAEDGTSAEVDVDAVTEWIASFRSSSSEVMSLGSRPSMPTEVPSTGKVE